MFRDIIRCNYVCCVYGKVTFKKVNQLRYDSVSKKYQATVQLNSVLLIACFPLCKALVFLRLAEYHLKVSNGAKIRNRYNQVPHLTQDTKSHIQRANSQEFISIF